MKNNFKYAILGAIAFPSLFLISCSEKDNPEDKDSLNTTIITFADVPTQYFADDEYGSNLYYGAENQVTTGYLAPLKYGKYAQFSINYGNTFDASYNQVWGYSFFEGGMALSKYHNMTNGTFDNQLSVYNTSSPSGGNFVVAFGIAKDENYLPVTNPGKAKYSDYSGCAKIYITDSQGYTVKNPGVENSYVTGDSEDAWFKSVYVNNTTYVFDAIKNGNAYSSALNSENKGWFKVQFIVFDKDAPDASPIGYTEAYLANFNPSQADGYIGIIDTWTKVDLSSLPKASILVINFDGSDMSEYGLNTPTYCALDLFEITVED